ncbi:MAG: TIGR02757 family protein [Planctomycetota bacterium]|jgi:uncharacterized protein (TIGR02757 family)
MSTTATPPPRALKPTLEALYRRLNRREYVHPDPLEFLYRYDDPRDREVVGLVASALAYGRVAQILRSVGDVLDLLGPRPARFVDKTSSDGLREALAGFRHRFTTGDELAAMLTGAARLAGERGSLGGAFAEFMSPGDETVWGALGRFARELSSAAGLGRCHLVPSPERGSACKRLLLYLRWMVRRDAVDPGGWEGVPQRKLVVPLDTHMFRLCRAMGLTARRQANARAALEATAAFRRVAPEDPVRYDFALTRLGINPEVSARDFPAFERALKGA